MKEGIIAGISVWSRRDDDVIGSNEGIAVGRLVGTMKGAKVGIVVGKQIISFLMFSSVGICFLIVNVIAYHHLTFCMREI